MKGIFFSLFNYQTTTLLFSERHKNAFLIRMDNWKKMLINFLYSNIKKFIINWKYNFFVVILYDCNQKNYHEIYSLLFNRNMQLYRKNC